MKTIQKIDYKSDIWQEFDNDKAIGPNLNYEAARYVSEQDAKKCSKEAYSEREYKYYKNAFWEIVEFIKHVDLDDFKRYLKKQKSKNTKSPTGNTIFSESKYNAAKQEQLNKLNALLKKVNVLFAQNEISEAQKTLNEAKQLKSTIIKRDSPEFWEPEYIDVTIKPLEAIDVVQNLLSEFNRERDESYARKLADAIECERIKFKNISESDFSLVKQMRRLMNSKAFFDAFAFNQVWDYDRTIWQYDTLEDFFNRERNLRDNNDPELSFDDKTKQSIAYMRTLIKSYNEEQTKQRMQNEIDALSASCVE